MTENLQDKADEIDLLEDHYAHLSEGKLRELLFQVRITRALLDKIKKIYSRQFLSLQESFIDETSRLRRRLVELEVEISRPHIAQLSKQKSEGENAGLP